MAIRGKQGGPVLPLLLFICFLLFFIKLTAIAIVTLIVHRKPADRSSVCDISFGQSYYIQCTVADHLRSSVAMS